MERPEALLSVPDYCDGNGIGSLVQGGLKEASKKEGDVVLEEKKIGGMKPYFLKVRFECEGILEINVIRFLFLP